jgi:hypothetical protein
MNADFQIELRGQFLQVRAFLGRSFLLNTLPSKIRTSASGFVFARP